MTADEYVNNLRDRVMGKAKDLMTFAAKHTGQGETQMKSDTDILKVIEANVSAGPEAILSALKAEGCIPGGPEGDKKPEGEKPEVEVEVKAEGPADKPMPPMGDMGKSPMEDVRKKAIAAAMGNK